MLKPLRTLRARLTLYHVMIFGLLQAALWISVDAIRSNQLRRRFDADLVDRAQTISQVLVHLAANTYASYPSKEELQETLEPYLTEDMFVEVTVPGAFQFSSSNLSGYNLTAQLDEQEKQSANSPRLFSLTGESVATLVPNGKELRAASLMASFGETPFNVVVASDFTPIRQSIMETRILLIVFTLTSLAAVGITSWHLIHQSLKPVAGVVREARRIRADQLHRRISRPQTEGEIEEMIDVINGMLDRLEKEFKNQQQFISNVSHELKTPLAVLLTEAQALDAPGASLEEYEAFRQTALDETRKLLRIVESFLLLARARSGTRPRVEVDVPLEEILIEAVRRTRGKAKDFQVKVVPQLAFPEDNPAPIVRGDSDLLYTMIENLVRNAIRYSPKGGEVKVVAEANSKLARIAVLDRGSGVPAKHLSKIFDKFFQVSPESKKAGKLGIGLTIAKAVAELHGGSIAARRREGGGMEFEVHLPVIQS